MQRADELATPQPFMAGLEIVVNLLAPNIADRYFELSGIASLGMGEASSKARICAWRTNGRTWPGTGGASYLWVAPIETVSESEEGFERVYQGSQIMGVWSVDWLAETVLRVTTARYSLLRDQQAFRKKATPNRAIGRTPESRLRFATPAILVPGIYANFPSRWFHLP